MGFGSRGHKAVLAVFLLVAITTPAFAEKPPPGQAGVPPFRIVGGVSPHLLPRRVARPVDFEIGLESTGSKPPAALNSLTIEFDRAGRINPADFTKCGRVQLLDQGLPACRRAVVGRGAATLAFDDGTLVPVSLAAVNAGEHHGSARLLIFASPKSSDLDLPLAFVQFGEQRVGRLRIRAEVTIPPIADGSAQLHDFLLRFKSRGSGAQTEGFVEARCRDGHLLAEVTSFGYADGTVVAGEPIPRACVRAAG